MGKGAIKMPERLLTLEERTILLQLARQAIDSVVHRKPLPSLDLSSLPPSLTGPGASFVTLTRHGELRGCIGALEAYQPLAEDVREHAVAAATEDFRFPPVQVDELPHIQIEISRLTPSSPLDYSRPEDLPGCLRPHVDGVVLRDGWRRATFLPQVWEKIPDPEDFLANLCYKMGVSPDLWRNKKLEVFIYQVEEFHE